MRVMGVRNRYCSANDGYIYVHDPQLRHRSSSIINDPGGLQPVPVGLLLRHPSAFGNTFRSLGSARIVACSSVSQYRRHNSRCTIQSIYVWGHFFKPLGQRSVRRMSPSLGSYLYWEGCRTVPATNDPKLSQIRPPKHVSRHDTDANSNRRCSIVVVHSAALLQEGKNKGKRFQEIRKCSGITSQVLSIFHNDETPTRRY